ncbi:hypothetical protein SGLAM104S_08036 [Streptomyces glaucescens]
MASGARVWTFGYGLQRQGVTAYGRPVLAKLVQ